ncbi:hypothetical protein GCM10022204_41280 [Microlunatus aurantiacus]|uniref:Uncharacterized protein n=1 Tax=Microlunatus aurantiacus TaxID=446786 RepID=A0ABP7EDW9_9ACTN
MADHPLITTQLQTLASRLPPALFAEIADGLHETYQVQLTQQPDPHLAAQAAVAEFGDAEIISRALCCRAPWRRHAAALLVTGPLVGAIWATTVITQQAWLWPLSGTLRLLFGVTLVLVVSLLARAMLERNRYRQGQRRVILGAAILIALDLLAGAAVLGYATITGWIVPAALAASALRVIGAVFIGAEYLVHEPTPPAS